MKKYLFVKIYNTIKDRYAKTIEFKMLVFGFILCIICGFLLVVSRTDKTFAGNQTMIVHWLMEIFFPLVLGIVCSYTAASLMESRNVARERLRNEELKKRDTFRDFFKAVEDNKSVDSSDNQKIVIVLPSFSPVNFSRGIDQTKTSFIESLVGNKFYGSTKDFGFPKRRSFTQSDIISAGYIIALFKQHNMVSPVIRSDIQGLYKFFLFDQKGVRLKSSKVFDAIQSFLPKELDTSDTKNITEKIGTSSDRNYTTYIVIGLYSNSFLMNFLNSENIADKYFTLYTENIDNSGSDFHLKRVVEIGPPDSDPEPKEVLLSDDPESKDFALIAKIEYHKKRIFIVGGASSRGTEFAAIKLFQEWEDLNKRFGNGNFVRHYEVRAKLAINWENVLKSETYTCYPKLH